MHYTLTHKVGLFDIDMNFKMRIDAFARLFQDLATGHSTHIGAGPDVLFSRGVIWFLRRLEMDIIRYPYLDEELTLITWSRGFGNHKGFREYTVTSKNREIARGSSSWVFYNIKKKRIERIPEDYLNIYQSVHRNQFDKDIEEWKTPGRFRPDQNTEIGLRYSDFDANGHVNNTKYLDFIDTMLFHTMKTERRCIRNLKIRFSREISKSNTSVQAGWTPKDNTADFLIYNTDHLFADGLFQLQDQTN